MMIPAIKLNYTLILLALLMHWTGSAQDLVINEIMSSNNNTLFDEDGDTPDWVELYNNGADPIDLEGYVLADSGTLETPWTFPAMALAPGQHLLVFASDKDRDTPPLYWETVIDWGDDWSYLIPDASTSPNWMNADFDATSWEVGPSGFGYGDNDDNTTLTNAGSVFIRKEFNLDSPEAIAEALFHIDYDDGFVAYLNGTEIARENLTSEGPPPYDQFADDYDHEAQLYQGGRPASFSFDKDLLETGTNVLAVQVHNANATSSDLTAIPFLSFGSTTPVDGSLSSHLPASGSYLHSNFKINADGDYIFLISPSGEVINSVHTDDLPVDISYGRETDGSENWVYYNEPTPGESNSTAGYAGFGAKVLFSEEGGLYNESLQVTLSSESDAPIYYSTDGSLPELSGQLYSSPITISSTTVLRAQTIQETSLPGAVNTASYIIHTDHEVAVISLTTHPDNFWDYNEGIYVMGPNASSDFPHFGANFWEDWERPIHIEMYDPDGDLAFAQDAGVKIFGGWSRGNAQKSLSIFARKSYGKNEIKDKIFPDLELDEFANIVLRNSGNDWNNTMFRDALLTSLFHESVDKQAYRPAVIYLNGEYWGIQNIREKVNEDFLGNHFDLDPDSITILEANAIPVEGDEQEFLDLTAFIQSNSLQNTDNYEYVADRIDIENFIHYQIGNIFIDNRDWPGNNIKYWKSNQPNSKWRWIAYDTDFGFDPWNEGKVSWNTVNFALDANGPDWPNPPWSTLLLRRLMENATFKERFINTFADQLNTTFLPEAVVEKISAYESTIANEISDHLSRWGGSYSDWSNNVSRMKTFANQRPGHVRNHINGSFDLDGINDITLEVNDEAFGDITINSINLTSYPWSGAYFDGNPVTLTAQPKPGYRFLRWEGDLTSAEITVRVNPDDVLSITAVFEEENSELTSITINEINYNSDKDSETEDWVELYNKGEQTIDLSGWVLKDDDDGHQFIFVDGTALEAGDFLVICRDTEAFSSIHTTENILGNMDFGLSSDGDCVRLFNADGILTDEVCYLSESPWPTQPDGKGSTLALKNPALDNADAESWYGLGNNGNPGESNEAELDPTGLTSIITTVYPNPVEAGSFWLTCKLKNSKSLRVELLDVSGKRVSVLYNGRYENSFAKELSLPKALNKGVYFLMIESEESRTVERIMIQR
ncbi:CotH kinase family protein [Marinoscillum sp.]|uniref:CotH kinase family protein n=1 Tax=Marinoscillum sp. TaxID=2024838 RepID=UPI003BA8F3CF